MIASATPDSLWAIQWWEIAAIVALPFAYLAVGILFGPRVRRNRALARKRRRSERALVRRLRSW